MNNSLPYARVARWAAPLTVLCAAVIAYYTFGPPLVVLTLAGGAFLLVIWLLWSSVQALTGESQLTFEEAFSLGARTAEEEQKRAVLRALKDLEYERSVGKISEEDYVEYSTRYRAEAKRLIQSLDENLSEGRKQVERELERRLAKNTATVEPAAANTPDAAPEPSSPSTTDDAEVPRIAVESAIKEPSVTATDTRECAACRTKNELDARFCKACGKSMSEAEEAQS